MHPQPSSPVLSELLALGPGGCGAVCRGASECDFVPSVSHQSSHLWTADLSHRVLAYLNSRNVAFTVPSLKVCMGAGLHVPQLLRGQEGWRFSLGGGMVFISTKRNVSNFS
jgi:hypothetical protein